MENPKFSHVLLFENLKVGTIIGFQFYFLDVDGRSGLIFYHHGSDL